MNIIKIIMLIRKYWPLIQKIIELLKGLSEQEKQELGELMALVSDVDSDQDVQDAVIMSLKE